MTARTSISHVRNIRNLRDKAILSEMIEEVEKHYEGGGIGEYVISGFGAREYRFLKKSDIIKPKDDNGGLMLVKIWRLEDLYELRNQQKT